MLIGLTWHALSIYEEVAFINVGTQLQTILRLSDAAFRRIGETVVGFS